MGRMVCRHCGTWARWYSGTSGFCSVGHDGMWAQWHTRAVTHFHIGFPVLGSLVCGYNDTWAQRGHNGTWAPSHVPAKCQSCAQCSCSGFLLSTLPSFGMGFVWSSREREKKNPLMRGRATNISEGAFCSGWWSSFIPSPLEVSTQLKICAALIFFFFFFKV